MSDVGNGAFISHSPSKGGLEGPLLSGRYPLAIVFPIFSFLVLLLDVPPLIWHFRNRNLAAFSLILWILMLNAMGFINPLIWYNDDVDNYWNGEGLCDVEIRLNIGSLVGLPGSVLCIMKSLADIMDTSNITMGSSKAKKQRKFIFELVFCYGLPLLYMLVYLVVQPLRYYIVGITGCAPSVYTSWVALVILWIWPLLLTGVDAIYSAIIVYRIYRYRAEFQQVLSQRNTTRSRFLRLLLISIALICAFLPIQAYLLYVSANEEWAPFSWSNAHGEGWSKMVIKVPSYEFGKIQMDGWLPFVSGVLVFAFFGVGTDATAMYRSWVSSVFSFTRRRGTLRDGSRRRLWDGVHPKSVLNWSRSLSIASTIASSGPISSFEKPSHDQVVEEPGPTKPSSRRHRVVEWLCAFKASKGRDDVFKMEEFKRRGQKDQQLSLSIQNASYI